MKNGGHFELVKPGQHLSSRFGTDPEVLEKVRHIADWYLGNDVPEYEFWDEEYSPHGIGELVAYNGHQWRCLDDIVGWCSYCRIKQPYAFDTRLGQLTAEAVKE